MVSAAEVEKPFIGIKHDQRESGHCVGLGFVVPQSASAGQRLFLIRLR